MNVYDQIKLDLIKVRQKHSDDLQIGTPDPFRSNIAIDVDRELSVLIDDMEYYSVRYEETKAEDQEYTGSM